MLSTDNDIDLLEKLAAHQQYMGGDNLIAAPDRARVSSIILPSLDKRSYAMNKEVTFNCL